MSTYLQLGQDLHREARYAGLAPTTLQNQLGQSADIAAWIKDAWSDIQRDYDGRWKFLWRKFTFNTVASTDTYAYGAVTDVDAAGAITRFHAWEIAGRREIPKIYLTSAGVSTERFLIFIDWDAFEQIYNIGTQNAAMPVHISIDPQDRLVLGPTPNDIYTVTGDFWRSPQELSADSDEPECPAHFHKAIVYQAMAKYGYSNVAQEAIMRANSEGGRLMAALRKNQGATRKRFGKAPPMA